MTVHRLAGWTLAIVAWTFVGAIAWGQPDSPRQQGGGFGRAGNLADLAATQKSVQEELKLSTDEVGRLKALADETRAAGRELREQRDLSDDERRKKRMELGDATEKKIAEIVTPEQLKRLKQISLQVLGSQIGPVAPAFRNPRVQASLGLTDEQKEKIATITRETEESMSGLAKSGNPDGALKEYLKLREIAQEKIIAVLTSEQQDKWKEMLGEPFKGEVVWPTDFGGRGRGNRN